MAINTEDYLASFGIDLDMNRMLQNYTNAISIKTLEHLKDRIRLWVNDNCDGDSINLYDVYGLIDIYIMDLQITLSNVKENGE